MLEIKRFYLKNLDFLLENLSCQRKETLIIFGNADNVFVLTSILFIYQNPNEAKKRKETFF